MKKILVVALSLAVMASMAQAKVKFSEDPELIPNPSGRVPLAAAIEFQTKNQLDTNIKITDGKHSWEGNFDSNIAKDGKYSIPVVGMRPAREHKITLTLSENGRKKHTQKFVHTTPSITENPQAFPPFDILIADVERMEPGVTFLSIRRRPPGRGHWLTEKQLRFSTGWGIVVAIDNSGEPIWWYQSDSRVAGIDRLNNGNILMHRANFSTLEVDLLGNIVGEFYAADRPHYPKPDNPDAIPIKNQQTLHHQPHQLPNGNFLAFSANGYLIEDYWSSEIDPDAPRKDAMVMSDTVVEFTPQGEQVWTWSAMDYLDPFRIGRDTFWSYWWTRFFPEHMDWTHANGLSYDSSDDSVLVSFRNQNAVLKIDRKTKDIKWILGRHDGWSEELQEKLLTPIGDVMWPSYQHNPRMTPAGTVIMFDNRAHGGAMAFEETLPVHKNFSRGVEYEVDEENMTVKQIWTSGDSQGDDPCYTNAMSDAWRLPITDNRLVIHAFCAPLIEGLTNDIMDHTRRAPADFPYGGRILEYAGNELVFRAEVKDPNEVLQWQVYGGFKTPGIYHTPGSGHH